MPPVQHASVLDGANSIVQEVVAGSTRVVIGKKLGYTQSFERKRYKVANFAASQNLQHRARHDDAFKSAEETATHLTHQPIMAEAFQVAN
jgi:hypothetical protein